MERKFISVLNDVAYKNLRFYTALFFFLIILLFTDKSQEVYKSLQKFTKVTCLKFPTYDERKHEDFITIEKNSIITSFNAK